MTTIDFTEKQPKEVIEKYLFTKEAALTVFVATFYEVPLHEIILDNTLFSIVKDEDKYVVEDVMLVGYNYDNGHAYLMNADGELRETDESVTDNLDYAVALCELFNLKKEKNDCMEKVAILDDEIERIHRILLEYE